MGCLTGKHESSDKHCFLPWNNFCMAGGLVVDLPPWCSLGFVRVLLFTTMPGSRGAGSSDWLQGHAAQDCNAGSAVIRQAQLALDRRRLAAQWEVIG